jgi:hypothetical protein
LPKPVIEGGWFFTTGFQLLISGSSGSNFPEAGNEKSAISNEKLEIRKRWNCAASTSKGMSL